MVRRADQSRWLGVTMSCFTSGFCAAIALLAGAGAAVAQDAAETAIILGGTGTAQGRAQRSLGSAISRSMGNAANSVQAASRRGSYQAPRRQARSRGQKDSHFMIALPADVDPLANTDATVQALGNGASIRVSGTLRRSVAASQPTVETPDE